MDPERIKRLSGDRGFSLTELLSRAGVSRTAYYSLVRRDSVLPGTIHALAGALGTGTVDLLEPDRLELETFARRRLEEAREICDDSPGASFENIWHTLCLLDVSPLERLNRSLVRGRTAAVHR